MDIKKLCKDVPPEIRPEVETLAKAVAALQAKVESQTPVYNDLPLAQLLTTTQGEKAVKANPAIQEYRATVREYAQALSNLQNIISKYSDAKNKSREKTTGVGSPLKNFRGRYGNIEMVKDA